MSYKRWFDNHWGSRTDGEAVVRCYIATPEKLDTAYRIAYYDKSAAQTIAAAQQLITDLQEYRQALAARYAALETMPYKRLLSLTRHKSYSNNKVKYTVAIVKILEDKTELDELREIFPGTERHKAIARYKELQKQFPGIDCQMDIEKSQWER